MRRPHKATRTALQRDTRRAVAEAIRHVYAQHHGALRLCPSCEQWRQLAEFYPHFDDLTLQTRCVHCDRDRIGNRATARGTASGASAGTSSTTSVDALLRRSSGTGPPRGEP